MAYSLNMNIIKIIRKEIETCGKSRYEISRETGIDQAALCRIIQGGSCKAETVEIHQPTMVEDTPPAHAFEQRIEQLETLVMEMQEQLEALEARIVLFEGNEAESS